jgi:cytochrome c5/cytochrome c553
MNDNFTRRKKTAWQISKPFLLSAFFLTGTTAFATSAEATLRQSPYPAYPTIDYSQVANPQLVKKGEYLAKAGDCIACHTAEHSNQAFAGGLEFASPLGKLYTPNITSDKEHGIGKWTEKQFAKAMRNGVAPDGSFLYPAFPYRNYNNLSEGDMKALYAYFEAVPAIAAPNKKNHMIFPINWRFLQLGWRIMFFYPHKTGPYKPDTSKSKAWNRGKYLVEGLGHCDMCHTKSYYLFSPKFTLAAPMRKYNLAGANIIGGYRAPNITSKLMKDVPLSEITQVFLKDKLIGGGKIAQPPMLEVNHNSLSHLKLSDLEAIGTYLKTVHSKTPPIPSSGGSAGEGVYSTYCAACHTTGAGGAPKLGSKSAWDPLIKLGKNQLYANAMNGIGAMPRKGNCNSCSAQQIHEAVDYLVQQAQSGTASATPEVAPLKRLTLVDGKKIYTQYCSACHNPGSKYPGAPIIGDKAAWDKVLGQGMADVIRHTLHGYGGMAPKGGCTHCNDEEVIVAIKYMVNQSKRKGNYQLW